MKASHTIQITGRGEAVKVLVRISIGKLRRDEVGWVSQEIMELINRLTHPIIATAEPYSEQQGGVEKRYIIFSTKQKETILSAANEDEAVALFRERHPSSIRTESEIRELWRRGGVAFKVPVVREAQVENAGRPEDDATDPAPSQRSAAHGSILKGFLAGQVVQLKGHYSQVLG